VRDDMREYWREPDFWHWWWQNRVPRELKGAVVVAILFACGTFGYLAARHLGATEEAAVLTTERVTVVRKTRANPTREVVTTLHTVTRPGKTRVVTRDGRPVVVRSPGETITVRGPVDRRVVTKPADTVVRTKTAQRVSTVTTPGGTQTVTHEVTQPAQTVTQTTTREVTVTDERTVTSEVTVTDTDVVTVTVTTGT
jgi:hypothetical protein